VHFQTARIVHFGTASDTVCILSIKAMLMMDYISISLAVIICLALWWSFLAISGLKEH